MFRNDGFFSLTFSFVDLFSINHQSSSKVIQHGEIVKSLEKRSLEITIDF